MAKFIKIVAVFVVIFVVRISSEGYDSDYSDYTSESADSREELSTVRARNKTQCAETDLLSTSTVANRLTKTRHPAIRRGNKHSLSKHAPHKKDEKVAQFVTDYPYSVSIQKRGSHYATGALLDKRWILSVAGEFYNVRESLKLYRARVGSMDCKRGGVIVPLKRIEFHPQYKLGSPNYDVAMLMIAKPLTYSDSIRPISLAKVEGDVVSAKFLTNYWPRNIIKRQDLPATAIERVNKTILRITNQRLIPRSTCKEMLQVFNETLDSTTMCLKPGTVHHGVSLPDPGAPVVAADGLWGVMSGWTPQVYVQDTRQTAPNVFTRISIKVVRSWLDEQMLSF